MTKRVYGWLLVAVFVLTLGISAEPLLRAQDDATQLHVSSVAWSPDGSTLAYGIANASGDCDGDVNDFAVQMLNVTSGATTALVNHFCSLVSVNFSPDGTKLMSSDFGGIMNIWNLSTGQIEFTRPSGILDVKAVWSPDGTKWFRMFGPGAYIESYPSGDYLSGFVLAEVNHTADMTDAVWSNDGSKIASSSLDGTVQVWDVAAETSLLLFEAHSSAVTAIDWNPTSDTIASADASGTILIWDATTEQVLATMTGHTGEIEDIVWSPDGTLLASAGVDGTVRMWDASTGQSVQVIQEAHPVYALDWSPDGTQLAYGGADGAVEIGDRQQE